MGFIMNSLSIGGFKNPLSDLVKLDDGKFEVFLIKMPRGLLELQQIVADLLGQNIHNSMFVYFQADYLEIQSEPIRWTLDGEFGGELGTVKIAICPGSFDPITLGHLDVIRRASKMFERVVVCVVANPGKHCAITLEERCEQVRRVTASIPNVEVDMWEGLLVDYADRYENPVVVRGLRALSDFEYEFMMALTNKKLNSRVETVFLASDERYMYLSSTTVREIASYGGDISRFVPAEILDDLMIKLNGRK